MARHEAVEISREEAVKKGRFPAMAPGTQPQRTTGATATLGYQASNLLVSGRPGLKTDGWAGDETVPHTRSRRLQEV